MTSRASFAALVLMCCAAAASAQTEEPRTFVRGAYQVGRVMMTNSFVKGENAAGAPIDTYRAARLEFGWRTDGSEDWHQLYNIPSYGLGVYTCDYVRDEELGKPTSLYGFFEWPLKRWRRTTLQFDVGFGLTDNWVAFDPVENPYNVAIGAGRSVHIDAGLGLEVRLARRWAVIGGGTFTHFSNGGSQQPNYGINQIGGLVYLEHMTGSARTIQPRRPVPPRRPTWDLTTTLSFGIRNLPIRPEDYGYEPGWVDRDHMIGNVIVQLNRQVSHQSRFGAGLDVTYDESVDDLVALAGLKQGENRSASFGDRWLLGVAGGYELVVNRVLASAYLGYDLLRTDVDGRLPRLYQRAGAKYMITRSWALGLNVRFHDFGNADNLEINVGRRFRL